MAGATPERRAAVSGQPQQLSAALTVQRRMDPAIAELVSKTFYKGTLLTDEGREAEALKRRHGAARGAIASGGCVGAIAVGEGALYDA